MFDNESESINHKGLFTFYRQQAEYEQKVRREKALTRKNIINQEKTRIQQKDGNQTEKEGQPIQKTKRQTKQRRSFEELNKEHIKKLSGKNRVTPVSSSKQLGSEVVVILKGNRNKLKQDLKLNKLNLRYQSQQFSFMGRKTPDSFQDVSNPQIYFAQHMQDNEEEDATFKKSMRRNQSLNDRYLRAKSKLEGELLLSKEIKSNAHPFEPVKFEAVKKINILEEAALANKQSEALKYEIHSAHRRVPPKLLASILKSQTNEIIRNMRKSIEKEKIGKFQAQGRNHSYIEYGNYDLQKIQLDVSGLNQKQRRLISIFSKFNKKL